MLNTILCFLGLLGYAPASQWSLLLSCSSSSGHVGPKNSVQDHKEPDQKFSVSSLPPFSTPACLAQGKAVVHSFYSLQNPLKQTSLRRVLMLQSEHRNWRRPGPWAVSRQQCRWTDKPCLLTKQKSKASKRRSLDMNSWCLQTGIYTSCTLESFKLLLVWPHALSSLHLKHDWSMCPGLVSSKRNPLWILSDLFMIWKFARHGEWVD